MAKRTMMRMMLMMIMRMIDGDHLRLVEWQSPFENSDLMMMMIMVMTMTMTNSD